MLRREPFHGRCHCAFRFASRTWVRLQLDIRLRELNQMFEVVSVIDLNKNRFTPLLGDNKFFSDYGSDELGLQDKLDIIAKKSYKKIIIT